MKKLLALFTILSAFSAHSAELQLQDCTFKKLTIDFTPTSALTSMLRQEVKGAVVYKVKYKQGSMQTGPKTNLAVIDELPSKTLAITFFEHDEQDGVVYTGNSIQVDLKEPVKASAPVIEFSANMNDPKAPNGKCAFTF